MHALSRREDELMLLGLVEMDESYVGGKKPGKRRRGAGDKTPVAVMADHSPAGGLSLAHMHLVERVNGPCLGGASLAGVAPGSVIMTEGWGAYRHLSKLGYLNALAVFGHETDQRRLWISLTAQVYAP